jgi:tetratricopeptide (TPR) repeat protein
MRTTLKIQVLVGLVVAAFLIVGCPGEKEVVKPDKLRTVAKVSQPEEFYNQGVDALAANDSASALASFREAVSRIKEDPEKLVDAHYNIGAILLEKGDLGGAQKAFDEALKLKPDHRDALVNLGVVLKRGKDYAGAIAHYRAALKKAPRDPLIMNNLIVAYRLNKQYAEAEKTGHRLLARAPRNVEAYKNMTLIYYDQGKYEMAELLCINAGKMLEKQREKDKTVKDDSGIYNNLGMIYMKMGKVREALAQFGKALKVDPNSINALINTGAIAHRYRDYTRAIASYDKVLKLQAQNAIALKGLAFAYFGLGATNRSYADKAIEYFQKVNKANPRDLKILFMLGECYYTYKSDWQNAIKYYRVYKVKMGSALEKSDLVHNRLQMAEAKLQMAEQVKKDEEAAAAEARRKEEERKKALERTKQEEEAEKKRREEKVRELLKSQEKDEPPPPAEGEKKPEEEEKKPEEGEKKEEAKEPKKEEKAAPKKEEEKVPPPLKKEEEKAEPKEEKPKKDKPKPKEEPAEKKKEKKEEKKAK